MTENEMAFDLFNNIKSIDETIEYNNITIIESENKDIASYDTINKIKRQTEKLINHLNTILDNVINSNQEDIQKVRTLKDIADTHYKTLSSLKETEDKENEIKILRKELMSDMFEYFRDIPEIKEAIERNIERIKEKKNF